MRNIYNIYNVSVILLAGVLFICNACKRETKDERFRREFQELTLKECPKMLDESTRLDSASYNIENRTLCYHYTILGSSDDESVYANEKVITEYRNNILKGLKGSIQLKRYKDEGITFCYEYRSNKTGKKVIVFSFTQEDYN